VPALLPFFPQRPTVADGILNAGHQAVNQPNPAYDNGQDIRDRSFDFACRAVRLGQTLYEAGGVGRILTPQLLNCSTSLAAMLEEARAAESTRDFISKCSK